MKKVLLFPIIILTIITNGFSQSNFQLLSNFTYGTEMNDVVEFNEKYYLVGSMDSLGKTKPRLMVLDSNGSLDTDTILPTEGSYLNIYHRNNHFYVSATIDYFFLESDVFVLDSNLNIDNFILIDDNIHLQKSRMINDSIIVSIGYYRNSSPTAYSSTISFTNIKYGSSMTAYLNYYFSAVNTYDILPHPNGYYLFMNSPDSAISDRVTVYNLDDSLYVVDSTTINTSYSQFINNSPLVGPITAMPLSDSTFMLNGNMERPRYANQSNAKDIGLMVLDSNFNELNIDYAGKTDTNSVSGRNSIASLEGYFYLGNTENVNGKSEFMVSKADSSGNILWTKYYNKSNASIKLNKILATSDQHLLLVGSYQSGTGVTQVFVIKTDTSLNYLVTAIRELDKENSVFKAYPNPFTNEITIKLEDFSKNVQAAIYDVNGKIIKQFEITSNKENLDVSSVPSGVYFIRFESEGKTYNQKVLKL